MGTKSEEKISIELEMNEGWPSVPISSIANAVIGGTPSRGEPQYWGGTTPWATAKDVASVSGRYLHQVEECITEKGLKSSAAKLMPEGTVVITARGTVGALAQLGQEMAFNQTCYAIAPNDNLDNNFLFYALKGTLAEMRTLTYGSVFETITKRSFDNWRIPCPQLPVQRSIAHILGTLDDRIELNRRMNQTLEEMARTIYKDWFVDFGPSRAKLEGQEPYLPPELWDLFPEHLVDWELGEIPEGWKVGKLQDVVTILDHLRIPLNSRQRAQRKGIYRYYGAAGILDYVDDFLFDGVHVLAGEDGSVVDRNGHPVTQYVWGQFWVNNHAHVLKGKMGYSDEHIYLLMQTQEIGAFVTGAVQPKLNQNNLKSIPIVVPSTYLLEAFRKAIQPMFGAIRSNSDETSMLTTQRDTLLPKLISGELRPEGSCITNEMSDIHA